MHGIMRPGVATLKAAGRPTSAGMGYFGFKKPLDRRAATLHTARDFLEAKVHRDPRETGPGDRET